jgi:Dual specificity phosphatase, catalytic domain
LSASAPEAASVPTGIGARPWRRAFAWLLFLAPFFYLTYGEANWLAARRDGVPSIVFDWEHWIPFVDWTIIPYWSINAFYGLSFFVCKSKAELDTHGLRLLTAQLIAVTCFILFPLRFTFAQPETTGFPGFLFHALTSFDQPFNQAPSLHIALCVILWALYSRHVPRWGLWLLNAWFVLVAVSVLTTYQHHFIDLPTGVLLGLFCVWLWPTESASPLSHFGFTADPPRRRLALRYALGAIALGVLAVWIGGAKLLLFWPAVALLMVAANYALFGPESFQKSANGRMSVASRLLLAPYHAGAWINSRAWTRRHPASVAVADGVSLGCIPVRRDCTTLTTIDLCAELPGRGWRCYAFPMLDLVAPDPEQLLTASRAIEAARSEGAVLVYCALGVSRSASAVATWLTVTGRAASVDHAIETVRKVRPRIVLGEDAKRAIAEAVEMAR